MPLIKPSLALDAAGNPHISYTNGSLKYAHWTGSTWHVQTVDNAGTYLYFSSLALDAAGRPHISYRAGNALKYAFWTGDAWDIRTVEIIDGSGGTPYASLALDSAGNPHIAYHGTGGALRYARLLPVLAISKKATPGDGLPISDAYFYVPQLGNDSFCLG